MKYLVKYYDIWLDEVNVYKCKADNENGAEISFRKNVSSNVQRYKILKVKEERKCE